MRFAIEEEEMAGGEDVDKWFWRRDSYREREDSEREIYYLIHRKADTSYSSRRAEAAVVPEDDGTFSISFNNPFDEDWNIVDVTGFASLEDAKKYVEVQLALDGYGA